MNENILEYIKSHLLDGFEKDFFDEAIRNLNINSRLRVSNFSYAVRELIREVLVRTSPDEKIKGCEWFEPYSKDEPDLITREQRMAYAIHGGIDPSYVAKYLLTDIDRH